MELQQKQIESNQITQSMFLPENYSNKPTMKEGFLFESPNSSTSSKGFLQDFHYFDQIHGNGSSLNPMLGSNFESLDVFPYGSSSTNMEFYDYEYKPFVENGDNLQNGGNLNFLHRNSMELMMGSNLDQIPINFQAMKPINFVIPDEVSSCVSANNHLDHHKKDGFNKTSAARRTWKGRKKNNIIKGQWTIEEDRLLTQLVEQYGIRKWSHIAQNLPGRIGKQCRERWHNHLRPDIKKDVWSEEEDMVLIQAHKDIGNRWAEIAKRLPGRTENSIKNHWNATKRRQFSKRKCRSKYPRGTLLQEYIKSLNLGSSSSSSSGTKLKFQAKSSAAAADYDIGTVKVPNFMQEMSQNNNGLVVPNCEMGDFDEQMFEDGCSFDSLFDGVGYVHGHHRQEKSFEMDDEDNVAPLMDFEVKKELDLVEMISQSKM